MYCSRLIGNTFPLKHILVYVSNVEGSTEVTYISAFQTAHVKLSNNIVQKDVMTWLDCCTDDIVFVIQRVMKIAFRTTAIISVTAPERYVPHLIKTVTCATVHCGECDSIEFNSVVLLTLFQFKLFRQCTQVIDESNCWKENLLCQTSKVCSCY